MNRMETIIDQLMAVARKPAQAIAGHKAQTGKGAVGVMPVYAPEEIIHAAGYLPVGIWGGQKTITKARAYLPPYACSIMQSVMEMQIEGVYDNLQAVLFSVPCDTLKCMSQKWKGTAPVIVFTHPQNRKLAAAHGFLVEEYKRLREKLEKTLGVKITDEALGRSIDIYNENRKIMREFSELAAQYPHSIDPVKRHGVMKARHFMEKSQHTALVKELMDEVKALPSEPWQGKKVILTGITAEPDEVLDVLKENGFAVVADDLAQESRQFRLDVPAGEEPLSRLAKWWQDFDGCSLAVNPEKPRGKMLIDMVEKHQADAVVVCMMKFCDPEEFDYPIYYAQLEEKGIRSLYLDIDQESTSFEQIKTRVQSFREML
ncbi:2-hydroxyacyl-CoA dehydratase subunit D [Desulfitobacterium chlororespirans]|uniref:Benzoyl-CoA reductase, subunit C n=1 Tax=Desulfitobacterium chlororespirans DSM 11544 TaxID=1121395 RepID=A0A1M7UG59_9FIRM|nr:2-hydroxyacyl-CoA dehydratase family protein [Desulfitobacterium chlororespirans]SHN81900.1 benzoyl-CoA reductase, subunit C [Desulfitobacterium chlororespirans DSM 11544]